MKPWPAKRATGPARRLPHVLALSTAHWERAPNGYMACNQSEAGDKSDGA